jgi:Zn finger protein HypA/HybF involved in hydrogenase expression
MTEDSTATPPDAGELSCPECGGKGKKVKPITMESLLTDEAKVRMSRANGFRFCLTSTCEVAYFHPETDERFRVEDVRVRIGRKEAEAPRPVCYCFDHTREEIEADVARSGASEIPETIRSACERGLSRCEETNPQGSCCLGDVRKALKEAQGDHAAQPPLEPVAQGESDCCADEAQSDEAASA